LTALLNLGNDIPKDNDYYYEVQVVRGRVLQRGGEYAAAELVLSEALAQPHFPTAFDTTVRANLGMILELQGKYAEALE
ncbi:hypothetical protein RCK87_26865, partial [Salmonella enterica subsp. enterica serovar 1,4,[5],12:i:-]